METKNNECKQRFLELCAEVNKRISEIDKDTPWPESEPQWWLDMMEVQRITLRAVSPPSDLVDDGDSENPVSVFVRCMNVLEECLRSPQSKQSKTKKVRDEVKET